MERAAPAVMEAPRGWPRTHQRRHRGPWQRSAPLRGDLPGAARWHLVVIWILVGGQNGKNNDGPEEGLVLFIIRYRLENMPVRCNREKKSLGS